MVRSLDRFKPAISAFGNPLVRVQASNSPLVCKNLSSGVCKTETEVGFVSSVDQFHRVSLVPNPAASERKQNRNASTDSVDCDTSASTYFQGKEGD